MPDGLGTDHDASWGSADTAEDARVTTTATRRPLDPAQYSGIGVSTLLLDGETTRLASGPRSRRWPGGARRSRRDGARSAHSAQLTAPELVTEAMLEFLRAR